MTHLTAICGALHAALRKHNLIQARTEIEASGSECIEIHIGAGKPWFCPRTRKRYEPITCYLYDAVGEGRNITIDHICGIMFRLLRDLDELKEAQP